MRQPGFMLLELLVSMFIASLLAAALFAAFSQTNRAVRTVDDMVDVSYKETVAINQLTKDISGAFIPVQARKTLLRQGSGGQEKKQETQASAPKTADKNKASEPKKEKKRLTKFFYGTAKDGQLNLLTCITNNSTLEYPSGVVRVVYRLIPEERLNPKKPAYTLMRQESASELDFDDFNREQKEGVRSYELIGNVKKLSIAYTAQINKPRASTTDKSSSFAKATADTQELAREYKVLNEWMMEEEQEKQYKDYTKIPYAVDVDLILWDARREREKKVSFKIMLPNEAIEYIEDTQKLATQQQLPIKPTSPSPATPSSSAKATADKGQAAPGARPGGKPKVAHSGKGSALDQTFSALKTMLMADGTLPAGGAS